LKGDATSGILPAGKVCGLVHKVITVKKIIEEMVNSVRKMPTFAADWRENDE